MNRRGFLRGILAAGMAPAVVRAESLMKLAAPEGFGYATGGLIVPTKFGTSLTVGQGHGFKPGDIITISSAVPLIVFGFRRQFKIEAVHSHTVTLQLEGLGDD